MANLSKQLHVCSSTVQQPFLFPVLLVNVEAHELYTICQVSLRQFLALPALKFSWCS